MTVINNQMRRTGQHFLSSMFAESLRLVREDNSGSGSYHLQAARINTVDTYFIVTHRCK